MDKETYARIPETLELREIRYNIIERGRRTQTIDIITTLVDADEYSKEDIATLYGFRWNSELDIRSIKGLLEPAACSLQVARDGSSRTLDDDLGVNLIRTTAAGAALVHGKQPRQISFTSTCQYVLASWMQLSGGLIDESIVEDYLFRMLKADRGLRGGQSSGRLEPRVLRRRRHGYPLMQKPRDELRAELRQDCT